MAIQAICRGPDSHAMPVYLLPHQTDAGTNRTGRRGGGYADQQDDSNECNKLGHGSPSCRCFPQHYFNPPVAARGQREADALLACSPCFELAKVMNFDDLTRRYFGNADIDDLPVEVVAAGVERMQVDLGLEQDPARRFGLWSLLFMLDAAPALDVVFKSETDRDAARTFMN